MLLRSSSTPFLHHPFLSSPSSRRSSLHLRRAFSDGHLPSLQPSSLSSDAGGGLHTEFSLSIYNTFGGKAGEVVAAQLASLSQGLPAAQQEGEGDQQQQPAAVVQPDHPEVPLFLARGLGIDRIASGFFTAGADKAAAGCGARGRGAGRGGGRAGRAVQDHGGRAARQRAVPAQLRPVPPRGEGRHEKGRGVLLARHARGSQRRRDHVAVRQAGVGGAPRPGEMHRLLPKVGAGCSTGQPCPGCVRELLVGAGRGRGRLRRRRHGWRWSGGTGARRGNRASDGAGVCGRLM